jgi:hypothetical protein
LPGRNPREAVDAFLEPLRDTISCLARAKITLSPGGWGEPGKVHGLTVNDDQPVKLKCRPVLMLRIGMLYEIVRTVEAHHPTGRVSLESVVRACITEYKVAPLRDDWDKTLALREGDFQIYRSWS